MLLFSIILIISLSINMASAIGLDADSNGLNEMIIENINQNSDSSSNLLIKAPDSQDSEYLKLGPNEIDEDSSMESSNAEKRHSSDSKIESAISENNYLKSSDTSSNEDEDDSSDDSINQSFIINQDNISNYFDDDGVLKDEYGGSILVFEGTFEEKGMLTIDKNKTRITGINSTFHNTVFSLTGSGIVLANLEFVLDKSFPNSHNAGLYIEGDNITVYNITMNYTSPTDVNAIGIYSEYNLGLNLINNTINFEGHADYNGYNYGIMLNYCDDAYSCNNAITADLPLREVDWSYGIYGGVWMDKVSAFAAGECKNLIFTGNTIYSTINHGVYAPTRYPTLSSVLIYACNNATISNNNIKVNDFNTKKGEINYLYGLDLYRLDDVRIVNNIIDIFTIGGGTRMGTAYPIQVTGPANNIKIAYNNIKSFSFGPNIGIYSENYYGSTKLDIISNFINITGKAGTDSWSLVAGIEVQDSDDKILNNTIIVADADGFTEGTRLYGISYSQNTYGKHQYDIEYNHIISPNSIAVSLNEGLGSNTSNSRIIYNIFETAGEGGNSAARIGGYGINNTIQYNTNGSNPEKEMSEEELPEWLKAYLSSTYIRTFDLSWLDKANEEYEKGLSISNGSSKPVNGLGKDENGKSFVSNDNGDYLNASKGMNGRNLNASQSNSSHGDVNSTRYTIGRSGISIASASASAGHGKGLMDANKKSYYIDKKIKIEDNADNSAMLIVLSILGMILLGYLHMKYTEEE